MGSRWNGETPAVGPREDELAVRAPASSSFYYQYLLRDYRMCTASSLGVRGCMLTPQPSQAMFQDHPASQGPGGELTGPINNPILGNASFLQKLGPSICLGFSRTGMFAIPSDNDRGREMPTSNFYQGNGGREKGVFGMILSRLDLLGVATTTYYVDGSAERNAVCLVSVCMMAIPRTCLFV